MSIIMESTSKLNLLQKQNDKINQKLKRLQISTKDDEKKHDYPQYSLKQYQELKPQDSTPPPYDNVNNYNYQGKKAKNDFIINNHEQSTINDDDDISYMNNPEKYGYNPQLNMIKNKYFKHNMTQEQHEKIIIQLAMKEQKLESRIDELEQKIKRLQNKENVLRHEMTQKINDNNIEYKTQMMALAKNSWLGIKKFIHLNEKSNYPLPYEQRFALGTYYIAKQAENLKGNDFNEAEWEKFQNLKKVRNCLSHDDRSGDTPFARDWSAVIELMENFPIIP